MHKLQSYNLSHSMPILSLLFHMSISIYPGSGWKIDKGSKDPIQIVDCSHLYTWQDGRCDADFLRNLPASQSTVKIATGFGCVTLFWLLRNR